MNSTSTPKAETDPLISVIIPCYNQGFFLDSLLDCLKRSSYPNFEAIIVNDGSDQDSTLTKLAELKEAKPPFKLTLVNQSNHGLASARNVGVRHAQGSFIQFLDADDLISPEKFEEQIRLFIGNPGLAVAISGYEFANADLTERNLPTPSTLDGFTFDFWTLLLKWERGLSIPIHCALFRRSFLNDPVFEDGFRAKEDWLFWVDLAHRSHRTQWKYLPKVQATYRLHGKNMCNQRENMGLAWLRATCVIAARYGQTSPSFESGFIASALDHFHQSYLQPIKSDSYFSGMCAIPEHVWAQRIARIKHRIRQRPWLARLIHVAWQAAKTLRHLLKMPRRGLTKLTMRKDGST